MDTFPECEKRGISKIGLLLFSGFFWTTSCKYCGTRVGVDLLKDLITLSEILLALIFVLVLANEPSLEFCVFSYVGIFAIDVVRLHMLPLKKL